MRRSSVSDYCLRCDADLPAGRALYIREAGENGKRTWTPIAKLCDKCAKELLDPFLSSFARSNMRSERDLQTAIQLLEGFHRAIVTRRGRRRRAAPSEVDLRVGKPRPADPDG